MKTTGDVAAPPESELVAVGVAVSGLADTVRRHLLIGQGHALFGHPGSESVQIVHKDQVPDVARGLGPVFDEDKSVLCKLSHCLGVVGHKRGRRAKGPLIPVQHSRVVTHPDSREEIESQAREF